MLSPKMIRNLKIAGGVALTLGLVAAVVFPPAIIAPFAFLATSFLVSNAFFFAGTWAATAATASIAAVAGVAGYFAGSSVTGLLAKGYNSAYNYFFGNNGGAGAAPADAANDELELEVNESPAAFATLGANKAANQDVKEPVQVEMVTKRSPKPAVESVQTETSAIQASL